jgi:hypothetical protein
MTDHASAFRVAAPFLSGTPIQHPTDRIGGITASVRVQSTAFRILFDSIVLMGSSIISSTTDSQGWPASREPLFLLAGMLLLAPVLLIAAVDDIAAVHERIRAGAGYAMPWNCC